MQKCRKIFIVLFSVFYVIFSPVASVFALDNNQGTSNIEKSDEKENKNQINSPNNSAIIGSKNERTEKPKQETESPPVSKEPTITNVTVTGDFDKDAKGVDFFKKIQINLIGENLTDNNFLTKEGLHWSDKTTVELIKGVENGFINSETYLGKQNNPTTSVKAYSMNVGDSGRINYVGKTKSGVDLDLIWTVTGNDSADWKKNSGYYSSSRATGLAFTGEQSIPNSTGNSIVVLYTEANTLGLHYKIVKHGTLDEQPVILSFISTDIDAAQGVQTDLANIVELIPEESGLKKSTDGVIYDATPKMMALNGSSDLPKGGYLGAGFLSSFNYTFYSPAPPRFNNSYDYALGVRYDIFGSSLQADILTRITQHIRVKYVDSSGKELKKEEHYSGFTDKSYKVDSINIPKYRLVNIDKNVIDKNNPIITFIYKPEHKVTLHFVDEQGTKVQESKTFTVLEGQTISYTPNSMDGFITPNKLKQIAIKDVDYQFVYKKVPKQEQKPSEGTKNPVKTTPKREVNKQNTGTGVVSNVGSVVANHSSAKKTINVEESPVSKNAPSIQSSSHTGTGVVSNVGPFVANHSSAKKTINVEESPVSKNAPSIQSSSHTGTGVVSNVGPFVANHSSAKKTINVEESPVSKNTSSIQSSSHNVSYNTEETGVQEKKDPVLENTGMPQEEKKKFLNYIHEREVNKQNTGNGVVSNVGPFVANRSSAKKTIYVEESPVFKNTPSIQSPSHNVSYKTEETGVQEKKDPFLENTGMTQEDKKKFLNYIHEVAKNARTKYGNDQNKINHAVANAIAYRSYSDRMLQRWTNDFGEKPSNLTPDIETIFDNIHRDNNYKIDFPHLGAPLATSEKSGTGYELLKKVGGFSLLSRIGISSEDAFFQANSLWGDEMTYLDNKDYITDIDAYILKYHPDFKDLSLDERIEKYYSIEKLDEKRGEYYKQILEMRSEGVGAKQYADVLKVGSILSVATLGLFLLNIKSGISDFFTDPRKMIKEKIIPSLVNNVKELKKDPLAYVGNKIYAPLGNFVADTIVATKSVVTFTANKINNKIIKPIVNRAVKPIYNAVIRPISSFMYNKVAKPIYNNAVKPVYNKVIKPVVKWGYSNIVKPVYNKVIKPVAKWGYNNIVKPVYNKVIKPVAKWEYNNIVKPVYNKVIKPVAKWGYNNIVKPVYNKVVRPIYNNIIKPVYNKVVKPFVEPIYNKVIKPASNWISGKYNKAKSWLKKWF